MIYCPPAYNRMQQQKDQVGEVMDVLTVNVEKLLESQDKQISRLTSRADVLENQGANQFQTVNVRRNHGCQCNWKLIISLMALALIIIIIVIVVLEIE